MKKILMDCRVIKDSGIGIYTQENLRLLSENCYVDVICYQNDKDFIMSISNKINNFIYIDFGRLSLKNQKYIDNIISNYDVFFSPSYILYANRKKTIVTIHDLCPLDCRRFFGFKIYFIFYIIILFQCIFSKKIITISEFSKKRISKYFGWIVDKKIEVIPNGKRDILKDNKCFKFDLKVPNDYILTVGNMKGHKNFKALINFWDNNEINKNLVIVGEMNGFLTSDKIEIKSKNIFILGRVSDSELSYLYENAGAFLYPSLYEGFGLPLLEAMKYKLPIAASNIPVFKEIADDEINYFSPYDFKELKNILDNNSFYIKKDYSNVLKEYTWKNSVSKLIKLM